jgi:RNA polymerase sigma-70 factor (ECF subfamily)
LALDKNPKQLRDENFDDLESEIESVDENALELLVKESTKEQIAKVIEKLPLSQREALLLWMNDDLNFDEMGIILQKSPQAVKNLVHRAKLGLKAKIGDSL